MSPRLGHDSAKPRAAVDRLGVVRVIAAFKLGKALLMLAAAYGVAQLIDPQFAAQLSAWGAELPYRFEQHLIEHLLAWVTATSTVHVRVISLAAIMYAAVFATEGFGLWWGKPWAEWLTVIVTASFIPIELWELLRKFGVGTLGVVVLNVAILIFFVRRLRARAVLRAAEHVIAS
jgi:uncharacterized membrane protein (DUF2068 family)